MFINTGSDNVTLDISFSINSLTLGGSDGQLAVDCRRQSLHAHHRRSAHDKSVRQFVSVERQYVGGGCQGESNFHVTGDATNNGMIALDGIVTMSVSGTLMNGSGASINLTDHTFATLSAGNVLYSERLAWDAASKPSRSAAPFKTAGQFRQLFKARSRRAA